MKSITLAIGISLLNSVLISAPFALPGAARAAEDLIQIPVRKGESLMDVVRRTHPCPFTPGDKSMQKVLRYNAETVGADGNFTLTQKEISVPRSYMESATSCRQVASVTESKPHTPALQAEAQETGGGEAVVLDPEGLRKREHGEEAHAHNALKLGTFLEYSKLSASSSSGQSVDLTSKPEYGFNLEYDRWLTRSLFIGAHFKYTHSAFQELEEQELKEESTSLKSAGVTAGYDLGKKTIFTLDFSGAQIEHILQQHDEEGAGTVTVQHIWVPKLTFGIKSVFAEVAGFELGGGLSGSLYLPARGLAKTSPSEGAELFIERELSPLLTVELGFGAQFTRQGFEDGTQSYFSYGADFGLGFHF